MTHKDQAEELIFKFDNLSEFGLPSRIAKQCALIALQYLLDESEYTDSFYERCHNWEKVKQEVKKQL